jgi:hypothetical protein
MQWQGFAVASVSSGVVLHFHHGLLHIRTLKTYFNGMSLGVRRLVYMGVEICKMPVRPSID